MPYVVIALRPGPELNVPAALQWAGVVLTVLGVAFSLWAIVTLGRHYDLVLEVHQDHELVRRGPYSLVRHPVYTGLAAALRRAFASRRATCCSSRGRCSCRIPPSTCARVPRRRLLRERFGAEYEKYAREVPMLVPLP